MKLKMIRKTLAASLLPAFLSPILPVADARAQNQEVFTIEGQLEGLNEQMVYLSSNYNGKELKDSVVAKNGYFTFKETVPGTLFYGIRFGKSKFLGLPIGGGEKITITGSIDRLNEAEIKGASHLPVWKEWSSAWKAITARAGVLYKISDSVSKSVGKDRTYVDAEFAKLNQRLIDSVEVFVKKYPSSPMVPFIIIDRFVNYPNPDKAASTYAALAPAAKKSPYGLELAEYLRVGAKTAIGAKPSFMVPDRDGRPLSLASLKGKVVLVDFWASWCGPCRKENPNLVKAYAKYHDRGFEIVGISLDDKKDKWLNAIDADKLAWLHASDLKGWKSDLAVEYGIKSIPMSFLVDANGKIVAKDLRGDALEKRLETIFK